MKNILVLLFLFLFLFIIDANSQNWGYNNNRIAISADGNNGDDFKDKWPRADPDDWGGTPVSMAIIAKLKLGDKLVHFSYNNFVESNVSPDDENMMHIGVKSGIERFRFDPKKFFDVSKDINKAKESLKNEIKISTKSDPLYFIHMGPSEFFYQCVKECIDEGYKEPLKYVYVISHSGYNDNHLRRPYHHTMQQAIDLSDNTINYKRIQDQNASNKPNELWNSGKNFFVWYWMRDNKDPNIRWLFERLSHHPQKIADVSDAGLVYYLLVGDEKGSPSKLNHFFANEIVPNPTVHPKKLSLDSKDILVFVGCYNKISYIIEPEITSNKNVIWESKNNKIAAVNEGTVSGIKVGKTSIIARTQDGNITQIVTVEVKKLPIVKSELKLSAINDFNNLNVKGYCPSYKDVNRNAIAIDAVKYKDKYAAASTVFNGETGLYDLIFTSLGEIDGESKYRIKVNNHIVGELRNKRTKADYVESLFTIRKVTIKKGDNITVESNSVSNFRIPEGKSFAYARGRWRSLQFKNADMKIPGEIIKKYIVIEGKDFKTKGSWKIVKDKNSMNGAFLAYEGENQYQKENENERLQITFNVEEAGTYTLLWSMRQPEGERGSDKGNDIWINFDDSIQLAAGKVINGYNKYVSRSSDFFAIGGQLDLHGNQPVLNVKFDKPSSYTLKISGRSKGLQIDRFVLYKGFNLEEMRSKLFYM